jgi:hypothetical protein
MQVEFRWCSTCAGKQLFEQPPCEDGHGEDCLDLACVACGAALVLGLTDAQLPQTKKIRAA